MKLIALLLLVSASLASFADPNCSSSQSLQVLGFEGMSRVIEEVQTQETSKLYFSGEITKSSIDRLLKRLDKAIAENKADQKEIVITLDSGGGNINETIRAINRIRELSAQPGIDIHTKVNSYSDCESACTLLFTAGEKRLASRHSRFGFHSPKFQSGPLGGLTADDIEERYRRIWLEYVAKVDPTSALMIESREYLLDHDMSYVDADDLASGYVTDFI